MTSKPTYDLEILNHIEQNPDTTQVDLATQLGVAVGSVNWYVKRLINKGYIKVTRLQRRRLRYLLTPQGLAEKSRLTKEFMRASLKWYRLTREASQRYLAQVKQAGYGSVFVAGEGDVADIVRLSCLEAQVEVLAEWHPDQPVLRVDGLETALEWPASAEEGQTE